MIANFMAITLNDFIAEALRGEQIVKETALQTTQQSHDKYNYTHGQSTHKQSMESTPSHTEYYTCDNYAVGGSHGNNICAIYPRCYVCSDYDSVANTIKCTDNMVGFNHNNYIPSIPYIYNESQKLGKPLRDTATINIFSYDANLKDNLGTQDAQSRDIYFSVELKKVSNFDGTPVSAADAAWHYVGDFQKSPIVGGNIITQSPIATQKANSSGMVSFTLNTKNPFGKPTFDQIKEGGVYQMRATAWNTYLSANGVTKYYISSTRYETFEIRQNFVPEVDITNEPNLLNMVFSNNGVKTPAPAFKKWSENVYNDVYADMQSQTEGIFVKFSMRDKDTPSTISNWQKGTAFLKQSNGVIIAQAPVYFSEDVNVRGEQIVQSNNVWKTGYAYFGNWLFPANADLTNCTVSIEIRDYLNAACTNAIGTYAIDSTALHIDTKLPLLADVTQSTVGWNTSTVKPGVGISNVVYDMRFKINASDTHPKTGIMSVEYAITGDSTFPSTLLPTVVESGGYLRLPSITINGTYYIHVRITDWVGNEHKATYGAYTRKFEPEIALPPSGIGGEEGGDSGSGLGASNASVYVGELKGEGKTYNYSADNVITLSDLGYGLADGSEFAYKQGYALTLRVPVMGADKVELTVVCGGVEVPVRFLGWRKFELPNDGSSSAIVPIFVSEDGSTDKTKLGVSNILPAPIVSPDGHIVLDMDSVYVAEYQLYIHRDMGLSVGATLDLALKLSGQQKYPIGHPSAGELVSTEVMVSDAIILSSNIVTDGGTGSSN